MLSNPQHRRLNSKQTLMLYTYSFCLLFATCRILKTSSHNFHYGLILLIHHVKGFLKNRHTFLSLVINFRTRNFKGAQEKEFEIYILYYGSQNKENNPCYHPHKRETETCVN